MSVETAPLVTAAVAARIAGRTPRPAPQPKPSAFGAEEGIFGFGVFFEALRPLLSRHDQGKRDDMAAIPANVRT
jgi:hypothetical protein